MKHETEALELGLIAKALQTISNEISYQGLAEALLREALSYCRGARGGVLLKEGSELLAKVDASFPRERVKFFTSHPAAREIRLPVDLDERVLDRRETLIRHAASEDSALIDPVEPPPRNITQLCLPLVHQELTIGVLYLETERGEEIFTSSCVWLMSMLTSRAAVSFESVSLFEELRETNMWMVGGQEIGGMVSYRRNTRTLFSRASRECHHIFDIDLDRKIVIVDGGRLWMEENKTHGTTFAFVLPLYQPIQMPESD
jgi:GAF domain-containing protein